jgi:DNA-binding MltR family transcriptional regulator
MAKLNKPKIFTFDEVSAWFTEFQGDSDRASAVLAVAFLDTQLEQILRAFSADENEILELLKPDQPLGSFGARRKLCLSLGLISTDEASELRMLGKVRNAFAHEPHGLSFDVAPVSDLVQALALPQRVLPQFNRWLGRARFTTSVAHMHLLLTWRLEVATSAKRSAVAQVTIPITNVAPGDLPEGLFTDA